MRWETVQIMASIRMKVQIMCGEAIAMGPGKAQLLDLIAKVGSISGAAREMDMSYRRAWQLVDVMNRCWNGRLVETIPGRAAGGARLTPLGANILDHYRRLQAKLDTASLAEWRTMVSLVRDEPLPNQIADSANDPKSS